MDELYLDNIDEFVNDHNKIVTYKWLSLTLGVHVNTAKQMLYHYLEHKRKESSPQLHATYLVSGKSVDNGQACHKVSVVREDRLEDFKSKMSLVVSVHVYSVQKALLKDSGPLYSVDYDAVKDNVKNCSKYSAIQCASAVPMSSVELQQVREMEQAPASAPGTSKSSINGETSVPLKPSAKPPKGIMGMFSNKPAAKSQDNSKELKSEQKEDSPVLEAQKPKQAVNANSMANFFGNQAKKSDKPVKEEREAETSVTKEQQPVQRSQPEDKQEPAAVQQQKGSQTESSKMKRIEGSDSEEEKMEKKKRRRIKRPEPDSSDEDVIPDSPQQPETREAAPKETAEILQHSHNSQGKVRKRRRVLKSQTYMDDEGCIVTEKGYVSESYSEAEDELQTTKQAPTDTKSKLSSKENVKRSQKKSSASSQKGTKQASITGFFHKK